MNFADQRVLKSTPATLTATFVDQDGTATNPAGLVTIGITRADGTVLQAPGGATVVAGSTRTFALTAAQTASLDHLTCTWTSATGEVIVTHVDVVGSYGFTLADLAVLDGMSALTMPRKIELRQAIEELVERRTGWLWTRRCVVETFTSSAYFATSPLSLNYLPFKTLRSVKIDTVAQTPLTNWPFGEWGASRRIFPWYGTSATQSTLEVIYEAGEDRPPVSLVQSLLAAAQQEQYDRASAGNGRNLSIVNDFGNITFARATAENLFGNPRVDAVLALWDRRLAGVA